jgi:hypothetical protein
MNGNSEIHKKSGVRIERDQRHRHSVAAYERNRVNLHVPQRCTPPTTVPKHQSLRQQSTSSDDGFYQTFVKWNCRGSSVLKLTFNPVLKNSFNGFLSYVKNSALLLSGLIAIPICFK